MIEIVPVVSTDEVAQVAKLAAEIWPEHYVPIIGRAQVDYMLEKFQSTAAVAEQMRAGYEYSLLRRAEMDVGYFAVLPTPEKDLFLSKLYVRKAERGKGIAKHVILWLEKLCRERELRAISLTVNKYNSAYQAYLRLGFMVIRPVVTDIGNGYVMDDYQMERRVSR